MENIFKKSCGMGMCVIYVVFLEFFSLCVQYCVCSHAETVQATSTNKFKCGTVPRRAERKAIRLWVGDTYLQQKVNIWFSNFLSFAATRNV